MNVRRAARLDGPSTVTGAWLRACELRDALAERVGLAAVLRLEGGIAHRLALGLAGLRGLDRRRLLGGRLGLRLHRDALAEGVGLAVVLAVLVLEGLLAERLPLVGTRLRGVLLVLGALGGLLRDALAHRVRLARVRAVERLEGCVTHRLLLLLAQLRGALLRRRLVRERDRGERTEHQHRNETDQLAHDVGHLFPWFRFSRRFHGGRPGRIPQNTPAHKTLTKPERPPNGGLSHEHRCRRCYFSSTLAPASSSCDLIESASSWATPSLTGLGAPSTRSFASLRPSPVIARTTLITWIFLSPAPVRTTSNSDFSSAGAAPSPAGAAAPAATATGAAAVTPHSSSIAFLSSTSSSTVILPSVSSTFAVSVAI